MYLSWFRISKVGLLCATLFSLVAYTVYLTKDGVVFSPHHFGYDFAFPFQGAGTNQGIKCYPHNHVFFLKTHKCASSTVQNIFLRYGYRHNLTFALPSGGNYLGNPYMFEASMIPKNLLPPSGKVDLFAVHTRLNKEQHLKVLHNNTRWVTILRDPAMLYESLYNFFHMQGAYGIELSQFKAWPLEKLMALPRYGDKFGKNQMLFDLGYKDNMTVTELLAAVNELDKMFDLVMISELLDESLILMRHLLCWSLHDIVVFTKNARREEVKPSLDPKTEEKLRLLNSADALLYDHFLARHRQAVSDFGINRMADEVLELRKLRNDYYEDCGIRTANGKDSSLEYKEYSDLVNAYYTINNNTDENCLMLSMPELQLIDTIRENQIKLLKAKPT